MFRNYLMAALRNLARSRLYAAINIVGLAVGLCAALLIVLFVRDEYSYDRFFRGFRDVYLLTETKDLTDRRLIDERNVRRLADERWDFSFPDLAAQLSAQFPQTATVARVMTADSPPHLR